MDDDFIFVFLIILVGCSEVFFIYRDSRCAYKFIKAAPAKKDVFKYFSFGLLKILLLFTAAILLSLLLDFLPYSYYWLGRNKALIEALRPSLDDSKFAFYRFTYWFVFPIACLFILAIKLKKKKIALSIVFPIIVSIGAISFFIFCFEYDLKYYKNPLADTLVSGSFKPLNVPLLKEGMSKEEVLELLGKPIHAGEDKFRYAEENGRGWYDYFNLDVYFENDIVVKINKAWYSED
ncbi:hypothetical protein [Treponema sp.]|uniref:hypothetical protein n=1 Tax=Treponema sp. TaxID=166 RepID=UPI00388E578F